MQTRFELRTSYSQQNQCEQHHRSPIDRMFKMVQNLPLNGKDSCRNMYLIPSYSIQHRVHLSGEVASTQLGNGYHSRLDPVSHP